MKRWLIYLVIILFPINGISYEVNVHEQITENAINLSNLKSYLSANLKISIYDKFRADVFLNKTAFDWIKAGSNWEDDMIGASASIRFMNHFYDPTTGLGLNINGMPVGDAVSSLEWARWHVNNQFNWKGSRNRYFTALTARNADDRNAATAYLFRSLGQLMHLVHDKAVPAHVRNDAHFPYSARTRDMYERYARDAVNGEPYTLPLQYAGYGAVDLQTFNSLDSFWMNGGKGLAEFTNRNFVSRNTNIDDGRYPLPIALPGPGIYTETITDPINGPFYVVVKYLLANVTDNYRDSSTTIRLAAYSFFDFELMNYAGSPVYSLNNNVHYDYANILVPRAVGYSAGLLNYFFRGELGVTSVSGGLKIKNMSSETMSSYVDSTNNTIGTISVYYDNAYDERLPLADYDLSTPLEPDQEVTISFSAPTGVKRYIVVFRGKLGNEEGAVVAKLVNSAPVYYVKTTNWWDQIYKIGLDGTSDTLVYGNPSNLIIGKLAVSPDGNTLAFAGSPDGYTINSSIQLLDLLQSAPTTTVLTTGNWPSWSPDGQTIVFEREDGSGNYNIFKIDAAAQTSPAQITSSYSRHPAWSPDGSSIAYSKTQTTEPDCLTGFLISLMDTSGNPIGPLTCPPAGEIFPKGDFEPAWSPDGQEITFSRVKFFDRPNQLYKVNVTTKAVTKLTDSPDTYDSGGYDELGSTWSSDGSSIAISSSRDGDFDVWLVGSEGGYQLNLTNGNSEFDGLPVFGK